MKIKLICSLFLTIFSLTYLSSQTYNVNGTWLYAPTNTIKTISETSEGLKSIVDGDDKFLYFRKVSDNNYQSTSNNKLFIEFKSDEIHLQYNSSSNKQNTWTRYGDVIREADLPSKRVTNVSTSENTSDKKSVLDGIGTVGSKPYNSAVGLRAGFPFSVSYKKFINQTNAYEGWLGVNSFLINFGIGYQIHREFSLLNNLSFFDKSQWYFGLGVSGYRWRGIFDGLSVSPTGFLGWRTNIKNTKFEVGADWQPSFFFGSSTGYTKGFGAGYGGGYIRYILD